MTRIALADYAASFETYGAAIEDARRKGYQLGKYADPTEGERLGLTDEEAADIASQDIGLVFVEADVSEATTSDADLDARKTSSFPALAEKYPVEFAAWDAASLASVRAEEAVEAALAQGGPATPEQQRAFTSAGDAEAAARQALAVAVGWPGEEYPAVAQIEVFASEGGVLPK